MHCYDIHEVLYLNCGINDPYDRGLDPRVNQYEHIVKDMIS